MFQILCDAYVEPEPLDVTNIFDSTLGLWILVGVIVAFVILVAVILVRAVIRETKEKKAKKDDPNGNTPMQG